MYYDLIFFIMLQFTGRKSYRLKYVILMFEYKISPLL